MGDIVMPIKLCVSLFCTLLFLTDGCGSKSGAGQQSAASAGKPQAATPHAAATPADAGVADQSQRAGAVDAPAPKPEFDACMLIERSEIAAVQGDKVTGIKSSRRSNGPFAVSQCFYTAAKFVNSVSLEVNQRKPEDSNQNAVLEFWTQQFREAKDRRKSVKPRLVPGVGDEAYWVGSSKMGALYALKKDRYLRVSLGGGDTEEVKLQKSKKLAEYALKRL